MSGNELRSNYNSQLTRDDDRRSTKRIFIIGVAVRAAGARYTRLTWALGHSS